MQDKYRHDAKIFKALSDENRLEIMALLLEGEKCGCVLLEKLNIQQPTLSHHMKILCEAGLVDSYKNGKWTCYSICTEGSEMINGISKKYTCADNNIKANIDCD